MQVWMPAAPHFLYNTLTAIQACVRSHPGLAEEMIAVLARFVRAALGRGEGLVSVSEELALVGMYLGLERVRLGSRLRTIVDVDPGVLGVPIPALVAQPLVENAVVHGAAGRATGATLRLAVRGRRARREVLIVVADDGPGIDRAPARNGPEQILAFPDGGHLGLGTLRRRLAVRYGKGARLRLLRRPGGGTIAAVTLPVEPVIRAHPRMRGAGAVPEDGARADRG
jgi:LytS/YehU family sensor histidine kinase